MRSILFCQGRLCSLRLEMSRSSTSVLATESHFALAGDGPHGSSKRSIPNVLSSHSAKPRERPKAERGITKWMSEHILRETGILVPVGSGTINYEKKLRVRILTQAWEGRREILIGNRCSQLFSLLYINAPVSK